MIYAFLVIMKNFDKKCTKALNIDYSKDAAERSIKVLIKDKESGQIVGEKVITRGQLAKWFQPLTDHQVVGALNGKFIVEF
jgi:hypothetical protein